MMEARCKHGRQTKTTRKKRKRNTLKMASGNTVDLPRLAQLKHNMEEIAKQRKNTKSQLDEVEQRSAEMMLKMNIRFIDESGSGAGPFWTLCKDKKEGNWKTDRYMEFFYFDADQNEFWRTIHRRTTHHHCSSLLETI